MQLIKDLWAIVQAVLQVIKTLVSYVRIVIHGVENLIGKLITKKDPVEAPVAPVADTSVTTDTSVVADTAPAYVPPQPAVPSQQ
jgi:hypothetical protein